LVKVSNPRGQIKEADILRGLRWVIDTHRRFNVRIVNISVGGDFESHDPKHPLHVAVRRLTEAGVVVVAAAGNKGSPFVVPPASAPEAITVGGVDDHNSLNRSLWTAYPNNYGVAYDDTSKPEITAPARWIASPLLPESPVAREAQWLASLLQARNVAQARRLLREAWMDLGLSESRYDANIHAALQQRIHTHKLIDARHQHVDGTSVAAPIVSAVIAQMLEANPRLTPPQIRAILAATAQPLTGVPRQKQGAGVIDAARAVQAAKTYS
jgi:serine protease AprX